MANLLKVPSSRERKTSLDEVVEKCQALCTKESEVGIPTSSTYKKNVT